MNEFREIDRIDTQSIPFDVPIVLIVKIDQQLILLNTPIAVSHFNLLSGKIQ